MSQLPIDEALNRFKDNEDRFDKFVNGDGYVSSSGQNVESTSEFLQRVESEIEATTGTVAENLAASEAALFNAEAAATAALAASNAYASIAAGLAGTTSGQVFLVKTADPQEYEVYSNNAGSEVSLGTLKIAQGAAVTSSANLLELVDSTGKAVAYMGDDGMLYLPHLSNSLQNLLNPVVDAVETNSNPNLLALEDSNGNRIVSIDSAGRIYIPYLSESVSDEIDSLKEQIETASGGLLQNKMTAIAESGSAWSGYSKSGGWTLADGVYSSPAPSADNYVKAPKYGTSDRHYSFAKFVLTSDTAKIRFWKKSVIVNGSMFEIDASANTVKVYEAIITTPPAVPGNVLNTQTLAMANGDTVTLEIYKDEDADGKPTIKFTATNVTSGKRVSYTYTPGVATGTLAGRGCGYAYVNVAAGSADLYALNAYNVYPNRVALIVIGDSFVEGDTMLDATADDGQTNMNCRWSARLRDAMSIDVDSKYATRSRCLISGSGGSSSADALTRMDGDVLPFKVDKVVIAIGTNDSVYATWLSNLTQMISKVVSIGAEPILTTYAPRADRQAFIDAANNYVRTQGVYRYVDFGEVLSGGTGDTWVEDFVLPDNVHPSADGHEAMFMRFISDIPDILK